MRRLARWNRASRAHERRLALGVTCALALFTAACGGGRDAAARLANAAVPAHLPLLRACWEKEFEASGFRGEFQVTADFTVGSDGKLRDAEVTKLTAEGADAGRDAAGFRACIQDALASTTLPRADDENGPGFATSYDLRVTGYVFAFVDGSSEARAEAASRSANILIGPRADRCQGLYTYDPPRDEVSLYTAIEEADRAWALSKEQPEQYARFLQKAFDMRLELLERLKIGLAAPDLPDANRKKLIAASDEARSKARAIGEAIGCKLP